MQRFAPWVSSGICMKTLYPFVGHVANCVGVIMHCGWVHPCLIISLSTWCHSPVKIFQSLPPSRFRARRGWEWGYRGALHFALHFGGFIYCFCILQLLSVFPSRNALSLVFCEQDTLSFTKYINHRTDNCNFFTTPFTYQETMLDSSGL